MSVLALLLFGCSSPQLPSTPPLIEQEDTWHPATSNTEFVDGISNEELQNQLFDMDRVQTIDITLSVDGIQSLQSEPKAWVRADFQWGEYLFEDVGIRIKGNGSFLPIDEKPSLKIEFDKFGGPDAFGLDQIVLNNMSWDTSGIREVTGYHVYRSMGVPAVRATHAEVYINGTSKGIYALMEDVQLRTFTPWGLSPDGFMAEMFLAEFSPDWNGNFEPEDGVVQMEGIIGTSNALAIADDSEALDELENWVDIDEFLRFYAVSGLIAQFDAYPYRSPGDDVHVYTDPDTKVLTFIPHGLDEIFNDPTRHVAIAPGLLANRCYFNADCQDRLREHMWDTIDTMEAIDLAGFMAFQFDKIMPYIQSDPRVELTQAIPEHIQLQEFVAGREEQLLLNMGARQP